MAEKKLVFLDLACESAEEAILFLADRMRENGYVDEQYGKIVVQREHEYPTGLPTEPCAVAIPHAQSGHVLHPAFAIAVLRDPVLFATMGEPEMIQPVRIVLLLAIKEPQLQLHMLQKIMGVISKPECVQRILSAKHDGDVLEVLESASIQAD